MDNEAVRIARHYYFGSSTITADLAEAIRAYGEQCRRAGAEAMSYAAMEAAACTGAPIDTDAAIRRAFEALPSSAEAASSPAINSVRPILDYLSKHVRVAMQVAEWDELKRLLAAYHPEAASPAAGWRVPDGWKLVPVEMTEDMAAEMECQFSTEDQWAVALAAAPEPPAPSEEARAG